MARIFVSHSCRDRDIVDFISRVAAGTQVQIVFEELEAIVSGRVTAEKIRTDIEAANAVFILVTPTLASLGHSRDWVSWETGVAAQRDVWVFERREDFGKFEMVTPALSHLVRYDPSDAWFPFIRSIIEAYDDSHVLPAVAAASGLGHALGKGEGALIGAGIGFVLSQVVKQPPNGQPTKCLHCTATYRVHLPAGEPHFRCPVCNRHVTLQLPLSVQPIDPFVPGARPRTLTPETS